MNLGISSSLMHSTPKEWATVHKSLGLKCINFPLNCMNSKKEIEFYSIEAAKHGLEIAEVGIWRNILSPNKDERKKTIEYTIGQLELADKLHARCCVNILGARGTRWDGGYKENFSLETWNLGIQTIQEIIDRVNPKNTYFTIEPMPWMIPTGPDEYLKLLESVDRERFAVHMDIFNWITSPKRYFFNEEFIDKCFEKLGKYIKSCHLKDVKLGDSYTFNLKEVPVGQGEINIKYMIEKALTFDKNMSFIIEHLDTDDEYKQAIKYIQGIC